MINDDRLLEVQRAMITLRKYGIHSIIVNFNEEVVNFILYHIQVGSKIYFDSCPEVEALRCKRSVIEKGATVIEIDENEDIEELRNYDLKEKVGYIFVVGSSMIFDDERMDEINKLMISCKDSTRSKLIIIDKFYEHIKEKLISKIENIRQDYPIYDISVVFIA